jgi:DNA-binding transcriptional regulator YiaG
MKLHHMKGVGLSNIYLRNGFTMEDSDGDETISYENLTGLYFEIGQAIASTPCTLRAEEFRFMRKQLRMSQADIAALFDKTDQAVAKWEKGLLPVPKAESTLLKVFWLSQKVRATEFKRTVSSFNTSVDAQVKAATYVFTFNGGVWQLAARAAKDTPSTRLRINGASQRL